MTIGAFYTNGLRNMKDELKNGTLPDVVPFYRYALFSHFPLLCPICVCSQRFAVSRSQFLLVSHANSVLVSSVQLWWPSWRSGSVAHVIRISILLLLAIILLAMFNSMAPWKNHKSNRFVQFLSRLNRLVGRVSAVGVDHVEILWRHRSHQRSVQSSNETVNSETAFLQLCRHFLTFELIS